MIRLYASDARTILDALDDAESWRRQQARQCPCTDETEPGTCESCEEHLRLADDYADLGGVLYDELEHYEPDHEPGRHWETGPGSRHWGRKEETVQVREGLL